MLPLSLCTGQCSAQRLAEMTNMSCKTTSTTARKIALLQDAQKRPEGPQKIIVFSTFVRALDLMADTLSHSKLGCVMLHGQMTLDERSQVQH